MGKRKKIPDHVREGLIQIDGIRCHYCGVRTVPEVPCGGYWGDGMSQWEARLRVIDHKRAVIAGGSNDLSNLVVCCWRCNSRKGATPYHVFVATTVYRDADDYPPLPEPTYFDGEYDHWRGPILADSPAGHTRPLPSY
jgi:5-methylcytosine-specific restriction endonuclease McrA